MPINEKIELINRHGITTRVSGDVLIAEDRYTSYSFDGITIHSEWIDVSAWTRSDVLGWLGY